jgi:hypothetical protein
MKHHGSANKLGLLIAGVMIVAGAFLVARPIDVLASHPNMVPRGNTASRFVTPQEHVSPARSRVYGACSILLGLALGAFSLYRPRG